MATGNGGNYSGAGYGTPGTSSSSMYPWLGQQGASAAPRTPANPYGTPSHYVNAGMQTNLDPNFRFDLNSQWFQNNPNMAAGAARSNWMMDNGFRGPNGPTPAYQAFMQNQRNQHAQNIMNANMRGMQAVMAAQGGERPFGQTDQNGNYTTSTADLNNWVQGLSQPGTFMGKTVDPNDPGVRNMLSQYQHELAVRSGNSGYLDMSTPQGQAMARQIQLSYLQPAWSAEIPGTRGYFKSQMGQSGG